MKTYQTEQKRILLAFLQKHLAQPLSIEEIVAGLQGENAPGKSTVYRLMNQLVESGQVRRFVRGNSRHFVYQLMGCEQCNHHLHCRCITCGRLFHLDEATDRNMRQIIEKTGFALDSAKTMLLGTCGACTEKRK